MQELVKKICDNCIHYNWYWDRCSKYNCETDARSTCSNHQFKHDNGSYEAEIRDLDLSFLKGE